MLLFTDGSNHDDVLALICILQSGIPVEAIIITANGWGHMGSSYVIYNNIVRSFGRHEIVIIMGALYAHRDYLENFEGDISEPTGRMFGRTIREQALVEVDIMAGMLPELRQYPLPDPRYDDNYMDKIIDIVRNMDNILILSLGSMTDIMRTVMWMKDNDRLDTIDKIWQMGGGYLGIGTLNGYTRSQGANYNMYLDPDAAQYCLETIPEKIIWVEGSATSAPTYGPGDVQPVNHATRLTHQYLNYLNQNTYGGIPTDQQGRFMAWDLNTFLIMMNPEAIVSQITDRVVFNTDSEVIIDRTDDDTSVTYRYSNELATLSPSPTGSKSTFIVQSNPDIIMDTYRRIMYPPRSNYQAIIVILIVVIIFMILIYSMSRGKLRVF